MPFPSGELQQPTEIPPKHAPTDHPAPALPCGVNVSARTFMPRVRRATDNLAEVDTSPSASPMKNQVVALIGAVYYLRGPLIVLNALTCTIEILLPG